MSAFDRPGFAESSHLNGFSGNRLERHSEHRSGTAIADALADPAARLYLFAAERSLSRPGNSLHPLFSPGEAEALGLRRESLVLLGWRDGAPRLAGLVGDPEALPESVKAIDLRSLAVQGALAPADLGAIAQARSLLHWHETHGFCARCGAPTRMAGGGVRRQCPACQAEHFPRTDPVAIMLAISGESCLLGRQPRFAPGMYSALAGFIEPGETIEDAVRREVREEAGVEIGRVAYLSSQPWPFPASLMIGCHAEALTEAVTRDEAELEDCRWFPRDEVRAMLAGTHPAGLAAPPPMAIAHRLLAAFAAG